MVDFNKVNEYISYIENNEIPEDMKFNEFMINFFNASKVIPLSKYLRNMGKTKKLPKIMNAKKLGEILIDTEKSSDELFTFFKRKGFNGIPELNYSVLSLVRKVSILDNWKKIIEYLTSDKTISEINNTTKQILLPTEIEKLENFIKDSLKIDEEKFIWLLTKYKKIMDEKELKKAMNKLIRQ